jgi:hypothetical protein
MKRRDGIHELSPYGVLLSVREPIRKAKHDGGHRSRTVTARAKGSSNVHDQNQCIAIGHD